MSRRADPTAWMWAEACDLIDQAERLHRQFFRLSGTAGAQAVWEPPVDVFEDEAEIVVVVALPGVIPGDVEVAIERGDLIVHARRPLAVSGTRHAVRQLEIPYGFFERRIALPPARVHGALHELAHGCLIVRLQKVA